MEETIGLYYRNNSITKTYARKKYIEVLSNVNNVGAVF
jgi:hypothetical protein